MRITTAILTTVILTAFAQAQEVRRAIPIDGSSVVVEASSANEVAKFLAGVPLPERSRLSAWQRLPEYREHVDSLARVSQRYDRHFFSKMREWSAAELAPRIPMGLPVFYFFSGPDAVSPLALYPQAPVYLLGGLEPVGSLPDPSVLSRGEVAAGLQNLRKSTEVILSFGHFITKDMKAELDRTAIRGVAPVICTFIILAGGDVLSVRPVRLTFGGNLVESGSQRGHPGVRIDFRRAAGAAPQTIYYVQANVADEALKGDRSLLAWAESFGRGNVYLKAASYLLHESYFSRIREFLLASGVSVLQDDSGIPFRFFRNGEWRCWLFGAYTGTLDIFTKYLQPDLNQAFATGASPLPFGIGYKWREGESNLLLAVRQSPAAAVPAATPLTP